ncbi:MAG: hypothetical protein GWN00_09695 [Aliifodinibius sp.]|nr:hypothetical protein [candidate division Zixibacteria bacterium]NIT56482.1 hypothetical protein [Fodinibius sp.]NIV11467.1 hypothetical protein [Fodinibius sp.]NIY25065.1 hypothetical protein [Fodinibius sp.]
MFGLFIALGSAAKRLEDQKIKESWPADSACDFLSPLPEIKIARFTPKSYTQDPGFVWSDDRKVLVCLDGFIITERSKNASSLEAHAKTFANTISQDGYEAALKSIISGTYNIVAADVQNSRCYVSNDHVGSLPLYYSEIPEGCVIATNPVALAKTGIIDAEVDLTGCAEWIFIGCTIGDRYMLRGIKNTLPYYSLIWDKETSGINIRPNPESPWEIVPSNSTPSIDEVADTFIESCERISNIVPKPAHFQSAGKDSRLILAAWPHEHKLDCYTYGDPDSLEVGISKSIADLKGNVWKHVWLDGDKVADNLENIFNACGMIIWPDRWFAAKKMSQDGYGWTTDGFWGNVQIHPGGYDCEKYFSRLSKIASYFTIYIDQSISKIGLDRIAETMNRHVHRTHHSYQDLTDFLSEDFIDEISKQEPAILEDVRKEIYRLVPSNDSLAILWRKFISANRGCHQHGQQGVQCRYFINALYPFCADLDHHITQIKVRPSISAYDRHVINLYRKRFRDYGKLPYGSTLMPLNTPAFRSKLCKVLISKGIHIPFLTGNPKGKERDANSWGRWLITSKSLRKAAKHFMDEGDITNSSNFDKSMTRIVNGELNGTGQIFHMASIARWIKLSSGSS